MFDAGALVHWLGDTTKLVVEGNYRYMPGRAGFDAAVSYTTSALTFDDAVPQVHSLAVYAGPVFRIGKAENAEGFWVRLRGAAAYGTLYAATEEGALEDKAFWFGGDLGGGYTFRFKGGRLVLDPYIGLKYLYGYLFPAWGCYIGLGF